MSGQIHRIAKALEVPGEHDLYRNEDILPLVPARRTWSKQTFLWFWLSTSINIGGLTGSASVLSLGLTVWQATLCDVIGSSIICLALVANGRPGGRYGVPFTIACRSSWGVRGAWFVVCNRLILSFCWFGVQSWWGGQVCVNLIGAMAPQFYTMRNHFPASVHMTTADFIGFLCFWTLSLPILAIKPERYRMPAIVSSIAVTVGVIALLIWALVKQGGGGPLLYETSVTLGKARLQGSALAWAMTRSVTTTIGGWAGAILYQSDFSRYARREGDQVLGQIFVIPLCLILSSVIGLVITSCAAGFYPYEEFGLLWRPYKLMQVIQEQEATAGARAAIFFLSLSFLTSQFCVNTAGCAIVGSIDLQCLLPKWVDGRRGPYIVAIVGFALCPWNLVNNAATFISVLSGFSIFLGPLAGIMISDYAFVRSSRLKLSHLYIANNGSDYWFWHGLNPRAVVIWSLSICPSFPGFISTISKGKIAVPNGWVHTSYLAWILGFVISSTLWVASNNIWPPPGVGEIDEGFDLSLRDEPTLTTEEERRESGEETSRSPIRPPLENYAPGGHSLLPIRPAISPSSHL